MQFSGRFSGFAAMSTCLCHIERALPNARDAIKLEAPHSFELRDSGDYRRAARSNFGASFENQSRQNVMTLVYIAVPRRSITGRS
ncbi:hypothetical protein [Caballeronia temeraria]|uniref:hypothetical protein n=1 Tax=Caballeronia temeraria TaxID=1777137 RepID=UPI0014289EB9|nr:hypothetical protein [Caballeronia temeraria]